MKTNHEIRISKIILALLIIFTSLITKNAFAECEDPLTCTGYDSEYVFGPYADEDEAEAACISIYGAGFTSTATRCDSTWNVGYRYESNHNRFFFWPRSQDCLDYYGSLIDEDGDGLTNDVDPFPYSDNPFIWGAAVAYYDGEGNILGYTYYAQDSVTGEIYYWYEGDELVEGEFYIGIGDSFETYDENDFATIYGETDSIEYSTSSDPTGENSSYQDGDYQETTETTSGSTVEGTETDSELLQKITDNTAAVTENQQIISDGLTGIENKIETTNRLLKNQTDKILTQEETAEALKDGLEEFYDEESENITEPSATDWTLNDTNYSTALDTINSDVETDEIPDEYESRVDLETEMEAIEDESGVKTQVQNILEGSAVTSTGDCSFTFDYKGQDINFTMCNYASVLQTFGLLMQSLVGLNCILIIFRRR